MENEIFRKGERRLEKLRKNGKIKRDSEWIKIEREERLMGKNGRDGGVAVKEKVRMPKESVTRRKSCMLRSKNATKKQGYYLTSDTARSVVQSLYLKTMEKPTAVNPVGISATRKPN